MRRKQLFFDLARLSAIKVAEVRHRSLLWPTYFEPFIPDLSNNERAHSYSMAHLAERGV
jgi:hypothetical protein